MAIDWENITICVKELKPDNGITVGRQVKYWMTYAFILVQLYPFLFRSWSLLCNVISLNPDKKASVTINFSPVKYGSRPMIHSYTIGASIPMLCQSQFWGIFFENIMQSFGHNLISWLCNAAINDLVISTTLLIHLNLSFTTLVTYRKEDKTNSEEMQSQKIIYWIALHWGECYFPSLRTDKYRLPRLFSVLATWPNHVKQSTNLRSTNKSCCFLNYFTVNYIGQHIYFSQPI